MKKQNKRSIQKAYLCPGTMEWSQIPNGFGSTMAGWKCSTCRKILHSGAHSLQHVALKVEVQA